MSRNDIRLRRKMMTSRKIERHKDYGSLLNKYKRENGLKRWYKWMALILLFIVLIMLGFYIF